MAKTDTGSGISGIGIAVLFAGGILVWSGVKGYSVSHVFRDVIAGKKPTQGQPDYPVTIGGIFTSLLHGGGGSSGGSGSVTSSGGQVAQSNAANKKLGQKMAAAMGWGSGDQWTALNNIVMSESGWSSTIKNPGSNASGIAQNIAGFGPGYESGNAPQQIAWLLRYIKQRYKTPVDAWNFHLAHGWY